MKLPQLPADAWMQLYCAMFLLYIKRTQDQRIVLISAALPQKSSRHRPPGAAGRIGLWLPPLVSHSCHGSRLVAGLLVKFRKRYPAPPTLVVKVHVAGRSPLPAMR